MDFHDIWYGYHDTERLPDFVLGQFLTYTVKDEVQIRA